MLARATTSQLSKYHYSPMQTQSLQMLLELSQSHGMRPSMATDPYSTTELGEEKQVQVKNHTSGLCSKAEDHDHSSALWLPRCSCGNV